MSLANPWICENGRGRLLGHPVSEKWMAWGIGVTDMSGTSCWSDRMTRRICRRAGYRIMRHSEWLALRQIETECALSA